MKPLTVEAVDPHAPQDLGAFRNVRAWIFDLDNTLYPRETDLFRQVDQRIRTFVQNLLGVDEAEAQRIQKSFYRDHGTTLRGLMLNHQVDPDAFLEFVHDIDHSVVRPDPVLGAAILRLPGKKYIFTNGSRRHAEKVAARLGFPEHFEDIFDIAAANLVPKPERETYDRFVARFGVDPAQAAMFEDLARNLVVPKAVGMRTVLVVPPGTREVFHGEWEFEGRDDDHVDYVTDDLGRFVGEIAGAIGA
ncbi:pyrimidine 5'-nucleotidase [Propylenella binzhouense]|uniref:Pyrimidine 5'-nucleotidase n=1 Tax=Propylenella binzhouense TaxID=2555902 RepID=A0A964WVL5_9HYPH|nr:pyrimidine 5'-nucleotidase [Propylenella binzhouense]